MNEASSKFVDQFALEKLLNEKLAKVHHSPLTSYFREETSFFADFDSVTYLSSEVTRLKNDPSFQVISMLSPIQAEPYPENRHIYLHFHPVDEAVGNILLVHGLFDDNIINYNFLIQLLNEAGLNVFLFILPYHYERKPAASLFSGEYFWSADLFRSQHAAKQSVFDLKFAVRMIRDIASLPTMITGFSMGGCISLRYFLLEDMAEGLFLINPVTRLSQLIWENPLLCSVQKDLERAGYSMERAEKHFQALDPVSNITYRPFRKPVAIGYALYDQIISNKMYADFIEKFGFDIVIPYHAGHLNILRVPKLARDIALYFHSVVGRDSNWNVRDNDEEVLLYR
jgi:pimeloyl-ACP methyl ester carboxylesterase